MPIYLLPQDEIAFPHPTLADENGILAVGGDLSTERLILAYQSGIFPWYSEGEPIIWWSPDPRFVLYPKKLKISKSMRSYFNQRKFKVTYDSNFDYVIKACQAIQRKGQSGTWITYEMLESYRKLHLEGYAHSVEVWEKDEIVGGLYGIALGKMFFGESMFSLKSNASKFGFISLVRNLKKLEFSLIDCQQETPHLKSLGAEAIPRSLFQRLLRRNYLEESHFNSWSHFPK